MQPIHKGRQFSYAICDWSYKRKETLKLHYGLCKAKSEKENADKELNKILDIEILNIAEKDLLTTKNVPHRYFQILKRVENKLRAQKKCPELKEENGKKKRVYKPNNEVSCDLCDKKFTHTGALTMHSKSHQIVWNKISHDIVTVLWMSWLNQN